MKPNPNWLQVPEKSGATPLSRQYGQNTTDCKGWLQQRASIMEFLIRKVATVYGAVLKFWKKNGATGVLALGTLDITGETNPGTQRAEVLDEVSST